MNPQMRSTNGTNYSQTNPSRNATMNQSSATQLNQNMDSRPPKPLIRASTTFYDRVVTDWWWWELLSWLVSFSCVMAIVGILSYYDGKRQPSDVIKGITLNAFISVFSAIAKATMILPVSEAIGQLKWLWFQKERKLSDFLAFDNASRGPWGSLLLLGTTMCRRLVSIGAAITVLALAFEPFFQQSVSFPSREVVLNASIVSVATSYLPINGISFHVNVDFQWNGIDTGYAVRSAALDVMNAVSTRTDPVRKAPSLCPTGRCTWANYTSLGVCHRCQDVSHLLVRVCQEALMSLPGTGSMAANPCGYRLNDTFVNGIFGPSGGGKYTMGFSTMTVGDAVQTNPGYYNSTVFQRAPNALLDFYMAYTPGGDASILRNATPVLLECLFQWCVKTFHGTYQDGRLEETVLSTYQPPDIATTPTRFMTATLGSDPNDPFVMVAAGKTFKVAENTTRYLSNSLKANLPLRFWNDSLDTTAQYPGRWSFVQDSPHDVSIALESMAEAMTNNIRTNSANNGTESVSGDAWGTQTFVETQWLWFLLPGVLLLSSLVLICATILKSRREGLPTWKSSALATLLHGLTEDPSVYIAPSASQSEVEAVSQKLQVKLLPGLTGRRLTPVDLGIGRP